MDQTVMLDATAQAELVRSGQLSPLELVDAAIGRIESLNPTLNAVIVECFDDARRRAASPDLPDGPFRGVPFLLKDIGATQAGLPYYAGTRALRSIDNRSPHDTVLGVRFREAGLITLGKTNLPELGSVPTTQPLSFGATNNPWDLTRSPSGSSGGAGAAVAAGMVSIAHANDGGGSTRLPASWCGLVGLKATRGRIPTPSTISRLVSELCVSRSVRDTATMLDAVCGATDADLYQLPLPTGRFADAAGHDLGRLRVALVVDAGADVHPDCIAGATRVAQQLESMGHSVETVADTVLFGPASRVNGELWMAALAARVAELSIAAGREMTSDDVEPYNWAAAQRGRDVTASRWTITEARQQAWVVSVLAWMQPYDVLVTPTSGCPPMRTADLWPGAEKPWKMAHTYGLIGRFTLPFNVTGQPAISLPLHQSREGLPVGVQLVAKMGREDLLLNLAAQLEQAMPFAALPITP